MERVRLKMLQPCSSYSFLKRILYKKEESIFIKVCPAVIFAKSLIPKEKALAKYDTTSINTNKGTRASGVPEGTKKLKNLVL